MDNQNEYIRELKAANEDLRRENAQIRIAGKALRDHFAGLAMSAMTLKDDGQRPSDGGRADMECKWVAKAAYRYADAMIAARSA